MNLIFPKTRKAVRKIPLEEIVQALQSQNEEEENFRVLFETFYPKLFKFFHNSGVASIEDIRDLIQNTFLKVYKNMKQFKDCQKFISWLFAIARNDLKDWLRKKKRLPIANGLGEEDSDNPSALEPTEADGDLLAATINKELCQFVTQAIEQLPKRMQECVLMRADDYSYQEIATALRISAETVKSQLYQGRKRLKEILGDLFDEIDF